MSTAASSGEIREVQLIEKAAKGDGDAFGMLFEKHFQTIYNYVLWLCNDPDQAEDLTQETFIRAHRSLDQLGPPWRIKPWLYRLAHNLFIDYARQKKPQQPLDPDAPFASNEDNPERQILFEELSGPVQGALVKLSPNYREALVLREVQGLHYSDISEIMGVSVDHVKVLLHRARASFKDNYGLRLLMEKPTPPCSVLNEMLDAYRDRELTPEQEEMVRQHVKDCPSCKQRKRELAALLILFRGQPIFKLPDGLHKSLLNTPNQPAGTGQAGGQGSGRDWNPIRKMVAVGALGAGIALVGWLLFSFDFVSPPPSGQGGGPPDSTPTAPVEPAVIIPPTSSPTPTATVAAASGPSAPQDNAPPPPPPPATELVASQCYCEVNNNAWDGNYVCATADGVPVSTVVDTNKCPPPVCGNGAVEGNEECDSHNCGGGAACKDDCTCGPVINTTCTCVIPRGAVRGHCAEDPRRACTASTTP